MRRKNLRSTDVHCATVFVTLTGEMKSETKQMKKEKLAHSTELCVYEKKLYFIRHFQRTILHHLLNSFKYI